MRRTKHSLSHYKLASFDMGELVPVACFEVLPGDSIQHLTSCLVRVSPLLAPVMHPVQVRIHHWFVPYRLLWQGTNGKAWEEFITGGPDGEGGDSGAFPTINAGGSGFAAGGLADYLGIPPGVADLEVSALPFRAYARVFNEFYRDEDLVALVPEVTSSGVDSTTSVSVQKVAWEKDRLTAARPWPQKGPDVTLPLGTSAPVTWNTARTTGAGTGDRLRNATDNALHTTAEDVEVDSGGLMLGTAGARMFIDPQNNLVADLSTATAVDVNQVREAFALQRYAEARAQYGSRFTEYLRYLGVRSSDARLARPEYLGGGKQTIQFSEVLQSGPNFDANTGVATLRGHGIAAARSRRYRRFFEEHGVVLSLMSVRPRTMYATGLDRMWNRRTKEAFWQKELELIGQDEVLNKEVHAAHATPEGVFGYTDRYSEYRHLPSSIAAEFRTTDLNFWHLARIFGSDPELNDDFVTCEPSKRINQVQNKDVLWVMAYHSVQARRLVGNRTIGRIL